MKTSALQSLEPNISLWLIAVTLVSILPHAESQPLWLMLFAAGQLLWRGWLWHTQRNLPNRWLLLFVVSLACLGILFEYRSLLGRDAGVGLLILFMSMKLLELKSRRDGLVIITLGYFLLLTQYFHSQTLLTGLWLLPALWLNTASLIHLHSSQRSTPRHTFQQAGLLILQALPIMLLLYLLFPRIPGPLWGLPQDAHAGRSGLSERMTPGTISRLVQNNEIAFRVRFNDNPPPKNRLYWRGPVMENFDGLNWQPDSRPHPPEKIEILSLPVHYETTLEAHNQTWLLALDAPMQLPVESALNGTLTATNRQPLLGRQRFQLASSLDYRFNVNEAHIILQRNLRLPPEKNPRTQSLAKQWRVQSGSPEALIRTALAYFSEQEFFYSLNAPLLGEHAIDDFLFQSRRGFCEHYAAAFTVLMRAAGIPARVISGYQGGELNPVDGYFVVRQNNAHAWSEVWLENRGWIRVDPTASISPLRIEAGLEDIVPSTETNPDRSHLSSDWQRQLRFRWEAMNNHWNQYVLGYDNARQSTLLANLGLPQIDWQTLIWILILTGSLTLGLLTWWTLRSGHTSDPAVALWQKALRRLARRKVNCAPWETPLALIARLETKHPELAEPYAKVAAIYLEIRYGPHPPALQELRKAVAQLP